MLQQKLDILEQGKNTLKQEQIVLQQQNQYRQQTVNDNIYTIANLTDSLQKVQIDFDEFRKESAVTNLSSVTKAVYVLQNSVSLNGQQISSMKDDLMYVNKVTEGISNRTMLMEKKTKLTNQFLKVSFKIYNSSQIGSKISLHIEQLRVLIGD